MRRLSFVAAAALGLLVPGFALAADPRYPDWPCQQIKVPEISLAAVWAGPPIDDVRDAWRRGARGGDLGGRLAARRTTLDEAEKLIAEFMTGSAAEKERNGKLLFAGLFDALNRERTTVMDGIERSFRRQKEIAEKIRADVQRLRDLQDASPPDQKAIDDLSEQITWETRVFEDRRRSISYVCEVPVTIDRRLFALGRSIQQAME